MLVLVRVIVLIIKIVATEYRQWLDTPRKKCVLLRYALRFTLNYDYDYDYAHKHEDDKASLRETGDQ